MPPKSPKKSAVRSLELPSDFLEKFKFACDKLDFSAAERQAIDRLRAKFLVPLRQFEEEVGSERAVGILWQLIKMVYLTLRTLGSV
jgi:hypothetical protein